MHYNAHIYNGNRTRLEKVIPLDTPFTLLVEASRICNFRCRFCPQSDEKRFNHFKQDLLSIEDFELILTQMKEFPHRFKKVYMHGTGESLLNPNLPQMLRRLREEGVTESIDLTSNAALLTKELGTQLVEAGLDHLHVSVEALSSEGYTEVTSRTLDFGRFINQVRSFSENRGRCRLTIKIAQTSLKDERDKEKFFSLFSALCDEIFVENIHPIWPNFTVPDAVLTKSNIDGQYGQAIMEKKTCPQIFTVLAVKCDGTISPCSVDWHNDRALGNIHRETLFQAWNGEELKSLRLEQMEKGRGNFRGCSSCGLPKYSCVDNLDPYASELSKRIRGEYI